MTDRPARTSPPAKSQARSAARLAAVQALYQIGMADEVPAAQVVEEFRRHRLGQEVDGDLYAEADEAFFADLVEGVVARRVEIEELVGGGLASGWTLGRVARPLRAILYAGTFELMARPDVPTAVVINEYVDVAHAFDEQAETAFVNGVLDRLARQLRS